MTEDEAVAAVSACVDRQYGFTVADLVPRNRRPQLLIPRQVAMYLLCVECELHSTVVAQVLKRDRTTIPHSVSRVEDMRDDPEFDALLDRLADEIREHHGC